MTFGMVILAHIALGLILAEITLHISTQRKLKVSSGAYWLIVALWPFFTVACLILKWRKKL